MSLFYVVNSTALYMGPLVDNAPHSHYAVQLTYGLDKPFGFGDNEHSLLQDFSMCTSNIEHCLNSYGGRVLILLADPLSTAGDRLQVKKKSDLISAVEQFPKEPGPESLKSWLQFVLGLENEPLQPRDERLERVLSHIAEHLDQPYELKQLAEAACLSESRLQHLFKEEMGIAISQYVLWERIKEAVRFTAGGNDLTSSALASGFSDSAHMSRTFKRMFGFSPSSILKNSRSVQVICG